MIEVVKITSYRLKKNSLYDIIISPKTNTQVKTLTRWTSMYNKKYQADRLGSIIFLKKV